MAVRSEAYFCRRSCTLSHGLAEGRDHGLVDSAECNKEIEYEWAAKGFVCPSFEVTPLCICSVPWTTSLDKLLPAGAGDRCDIGPVPIVEGMSNRCLAIVRHVAPGGRVDAGSVHVTIDGFPPHRDDVGEQHADINRRRHVIRLLVRSIQDDGSWDVLHADAFLAIPFVRIFFLRVTFASFDLDYQCLLCWRWTRLPVLLRNLSNARLFGRNHFRYSLYARRRRLGRNFWLPRLM